MWETLTNCVSLVIEPPPPAQLKAVLHYRDAMQGVHHRRPLLHQAHRRVMYVVYHRTEFLSKLVLLCLIGLGFFERPWWCIDNYACSSADYPTFLPGTMFMDPAIGIVIEGTCVVLLALLMLAERVYLGDEFWRGRKTLVRPLHFKMVIVLIYFGELMIGHVSNYTTGETLSFRIGPYCRIALLMCTYQPLRQMLTYFRNMIPEARGMTPRPTHVHTRPHRLLPRPPNRVIDPASRRKHCPLWPS